MSMVAQINVVLIDFCAPDVVGTRNDDGVEPK